MNPNLSNKSTKKTLSRLEKTTILKKEWDTTDKFLPLNLPPVLKVNLKTNKTPVTKIKDGRGYFIYGPSGIGKSHEAACILNEICKRDLKKHWAHWVNVPKLLHNIKQSFTFKNQIDLIELYSNVGLICLDDLGVEQSTNWVMQTLYLIINNRYENMLTTIITSNLSLDQLTEKLEDDRLTSRIMGMCEIVDLPGKDKRVK